jgi:hypothetical protein
MYKYTIMYTHQSNSSYNYPQSLHIHYYPTALHQARRRRSVTSLLDSTNYSAKSCLEWGEERRSVRRQAQCGCRLVAMEI